MCVVFFHVLFLTTILRTTSKTQRVLDSLAVPELTPLTVEEIKSIDAGIGKHQRYFAKVSDLSTVDSSGIPKCVSEQHMDD